MGKQSRIRYVRGYGYIRYFNKDIDPITGNGIGDIFSAIFKSGRQLLTKIPNQLIDSSKKALLDVGSSTIKAVGSRVGDTIADKIVKKNIDTSKEPAPELRRQILKELTFDEPVKTIEVNDNNHKKESVSNNNNTSTSGFTSEQYKQFYGSGNKHGKSLKRVRKNASKSIIGAGIKIL
jgi:hypothetical protein